MVAGRHSLAVISDLISPKGSLSILCIMSVLATDLASAQTSFLCEYCQNDKGNYTTNSTATYQPTPNRFLQSNNITSSNGMNDINRFYNFSDKVYETGLCRGDFEPDACRSCLNHSTDLLAQVFPNMEAIGGFDECILRFSNRSSYGVMETHPGFYSSHTQKVESNYVYSSFSGPTTVLDDLKDRPSAGHSLHKYATGIKATAGFKTRYALARCMPDLTQLDCQNCLNETFGDNPQYYARLGGRVVTPSCNFRYEIYLFYGHECNAPPTIPLSPPEPDTYFDAVCGDITIKATQVRKRNKFGTGFVVVATIASLVLIIFVGLYSRVKKANKRDESHPSSEAAEEIECTKCLQFDFSAIRFATNCFSEENKIGRSMFGMVYRGRLRNGQTISVKRFYEHDSYRDYFKNEVKLGSKLQHRNLVKLLGFCLQGSERFLIHEFIPTSLDLLIFDPLKVKHIHLDWDRRSNIIKGIARGLLYLHEDSGLTIIHCDIRANKILLDAELNPKILGFGRAKVGADQIEDAALPPHVRTTLKGYVAPEFFLAGLISTKADVFSFGVLLLEIVTGQRYRPDKPAEPTVISTVWRKWMEGTASDLVDPQIKDGNESEIMKCIHIGLLCVQENKDARPAMNSVVLMLSCYCSSLPVPSRPGYFCENRNEELNGSSSSSDLDLSVKY